MTYNIKRPINPIYNEQNPTAKEKPPGIFYSIQSPSPSSTYFFSATTSRKKLSAKREHCSNALVKPPVPP